MSVVVPPKGTRGGKFPRLPGPLMQFMNDTVFRLFRNRRFAGNTILQLSTIGARSGQPRRSTVAYFPDGANAWLIVGSAGGAEAHPAWVYNIAKHPDQVWVEIGNRKLKVTPELLAGAARAAAWQKVIATSPGFASYEVKTDRELPIFRLTPA